MCLWKGLCPTGQIRLWLGVRVGVGLGVGLGVRVKVGVKVRVRVRVMMKVRLQDRTSVTRPYPTAHTPWSNST